MHGCLWLCPRGYSLSGDGAFLELIVPVLRKARLQSFFKAPVTGEGAQDVKMETGSSEGGAAKMETGSDGAAETKAEAPVEENPGAMATGEQTEPSVDPDKKPDPPTAPTKKRSEEDEDNLKETIVKSIEDPPCDFILLENDTVSDSGFGIRIRSQADVNRRLPKHWLVTSYQQGKLIRVNNDMFPEACLRYEVAMTDLVIDMSVTPRAVCTMKELVKTSGVGKIHGYKEFPADTVPSIWAALQVLTVSKFDGIVFDWLAELNSFLRTVGCRWKPLPHRL